MTIHHSGAAHKQHNSSLKTILRKRDDARWTCQRMDAGTTPFPYAPGSDFLHIRESTVSLASVDLTLRGPIEKTNVRGGFQRYSMSMPEPPVPFPPKPDSDGAPLRQNTFRLICAVCGERYAIDVTASIIALRPQPAEVIGMPKKGPAKGKRARVVGHDEPTK
jgi:hypothetical protein